jgi:hypothetical protein
MALVLAFASYSYGKRHHFDHWVPEAIEYENVKVAAALSEMVYGFKRGYVAHTQVYDALRKGGMTIDANYLKAIGRTFPENLSDVTLLNKALEDASRLGQLRDARKIITDIKPVEPIDLGTVDFYRLSFEIFGLRVQSFFKMYYLLYLASIALFVLGWWRRLEAMTVMLTIVAWHMFAQAFLVGGVPPEQVFGVATPYSYRFVTVLGIVSAFHIVLALLCPPRSSVASVIALIGQVAILFFVSTMRRSALWEVLWGASILIGLSGLVIACRWKVFANRLGSESLPDRLRHALSWPAMTFAIVFALLTVAHSSRVDKAYHFSDEWIPYHMVWHSMFVGLSLHPKWGELYAKRFANEKGELQSGDALGVAGADEWLKRNYGLNKD